MRRIVVALAAASIAAGCASPLEELHRAERAGDAAALARRVEGGAYGYVRERAARALSQVDASGEVRARVRAALVSCVEDAEAYRWVRTACARTLAVRGVDGAAGSIVDALRDLADPEARYWLAWSAMRLDASKAHAFVRTLRDAPDLLLSTAVRQWLGEEGEE